MAPSAGPATTDADALQQLCEEGSELLIQTRYLEAERTLAEAERRAWAARDWDTLARLYMPLQEARRQRRQRCGEGVAVFDLVADNPDDVPDAAHILARYPHGQLLVAGWGDVRPAVEVRRLAADRGVYVESFLAAAYPIVGEDAPLVVIVALEGAKLPAPVPRTKAALQAMLPPGSLTIPARELPTGDRRGDTGTYADVMALWEKLHRPYLAAADAEPDRVRRMEGYRTTARVDYACELAHQRLSGVAGELVRGEG